MRNAIKKRMLKLRMQQQGLEYRPIKPMKRLEKKLLNVLQSDAKTTKYPKGSYVFFTASHKNGEKPASVSCTLCNKTGILTSKHIISRPPEWQNITIEEMHKIFQMFDEHLYMPLVYH